MSSLILGFPQLWNRSTVDVALYFPSKFFVLAHALSNKKNFTHKGNSAAIILIALLIKWSEKWVHVFLINFENVLNSQNIEMYN